MKIDEVLAYLKKHGPEIGKAAHEGNPLAITIVQAYNMYHDCPEAGAEAMLTCGVEDWIKR